MEFLHLLLISLNLFQFSVGHYPSVANRMPAEQSSTLNDSYASYAVDYEGYWKRLRKQPMSCSCTTKSVNPWWQVNILGGKPLRVTAVRLHMSWQFGNDFGEIKVYVSNSTSETFLECASFNETNEKQIIDLKCNAITKFLRIQLTSDTEEYLSMCDVRVSGYFAAQWRLLSVRMHAEQSSTLNNSFASYAVDGGLFQGLKSFTTKSVKPWLQVHLLKGLAFVAYLRLFKAHNYGRDFGGMKVLVSNSTSQTFSECASRSRTSDMWVIILECNVVARIVRIQLTANTEKILGIHELKIYGKWISNDGYLSKGMPASQSSTFIDCRTGLNFSAFLAVDGVLHDRYLPRRGCSSTRKCGHHWWQVYLRGMARVGFVTIYNSGGLPAFNVMVSNNGENFTKCATWNPKLNTYKQLKLLKCSAEARIVRIQVINNNTRKHLILCEVEVYGYWMEKDELLSEGMLANQSSTYFSRKASLAVDGYNVFLWSGSSCALTHKTIKPWWQVTLSDGLARVTMVSVYSRRRHVEEALSKFDLLVSNSTEGPFSACASGIHPTRNDQIIGVKCDAVARIVRIQLVENRPKYLSLCEVLVYGNWIGD